MILDILHGAKQAKASCSRTFLGDAPIIDLSEVFSSSTRKDALIMALCESSQPTGSHKDHGASWVTEDFKPGSRKVLAARSSGNHATAMSRCAILRGLQFHAIIPCDTSPIKVAKIESYGGRIHFCEPSIASKQKLMKF